MLERGEKFFTKQQIQNKRKQKICTLSSHKISLTLTVPRQLDEADARRPLLPNIL